MSSPAPAPRLPADLEWTSRRFPNANMLLLRGERPAVVDTGFAAHAEATADAVKSVLPRVERVVNTHWHSDHVGGNALLQARGAEVIASAVDAEPIARRDPGCCVAEYLDQPVPAYVVDTPVEHADRLHLGEREWTVHHVPGHAAGHIALHEPQARLLVVGDTLTSYDVGWVNVMLEGVQALDAALDSVTRLAELDVALILPGHGPVITDPAAALAKAAQRLRRQRESLPFAVDYGVRRVLSYQLMISGGRPVDGIVDYLLAQPWPHDAAALVGVPVEQLLEDLVRSSVDSGALQVVDGRLCASLEHEPADPRVFELPLPREWAPAEPAQAARSR